MLVSMLGNLHMKSHLIIKQLIEEAILTSPHFWNKEIKTQKAI